MNRRRPHILLTLAFCLAAAFTTLTMGPIAALGADQRPFEDVVGDLRSPEAKVRANAVRLLAESAYPEAALPIAPLLADGDQGVSREAMYAELGLFLGTRIQAERRVALVVEVRTSNPAARAFAANWGSMPIRPVPAAVIQGLLTPLRSPDLLFRLEATYALAVLAQVEGTPDPVHKAVAEALADRLGDPEPAGRAVAAIAAGRVFRRCDAPCSGVNRERLGDALVHSLNDPDPEVLMAVIGGLGEMRYERAVQALTDLHNYFKKGPPALASLDALARIGHPGSVPLFKAALARKEPAARRAALEGLARAGDKDAIAAASVALAEERNSEVALGLAFAQQRTGQSERLDRLLGAAGGRTTALQVQDYLVELGPGVARPVAAALPTADGSARRALLEVLGIIGGSGQLAAVQAAQRDGNAAVSAAADRAARRLGGRE